MTAATATLQPLLETMDRLTTMLETENQALTTCHPELVAQTVDQKVLLGRTFERQIQQLGSLKDILMTLPAQDRQRVAARAARFQQVAIANQTALEAAQRTAERVVTHIIDAVRRQTNNRPAAYSRPTLARPRNSAAPISITINQTF